MWRSLMLFSALAIISSNSYAGNFQNDQARRDLQQFEQNTYEPPVLKSDDKDSKDTAEPCRDEVASGYPSSIGSGSQSSRAMNRSTKGCDDKPTKDHADPRHDRTGNKVADSLNRTAGKRGCQQIYLQQEQIKASGKSPKDHPELFDPKKTGCPAQDTVDADDKIDDKIDGDKVDSDSKAEADKAEAEKKAEEEKRRLEQEQKSGGASDKK